MALTQDKATNALLDAMATIAQGENNKLQFDKTIRGIILSCEDEQIGKYHVQYQDSVIIAYSLSPDVKYSKKENVYIQVPLGDFNKDKTILGSVSKLGSRFINILSAEDKIRPYGSSVILTDLNIGLCSYSYYTKKENGIDVIYTDDAINIDKESVGKDVVDNQAVSFAKDDIDCLVLAGTFRTNLPIEQQNQLDGNYGVKLIYKSLPRYLDREFLRGATYEGIKENNIEKLKITSISQETVKINLSEIQTYELVLDTYNMVGQPFKYSKESRQYQVFSIDGVYLYKIDSIQFFKDGFKNGDNKPNDIFLTKLECYLAQQLTEEELNSSFITFAPGKHYLEKNGDQIEMKAIVRAQGKKINNNEHDVDFYWFKKDLSVTSSTSPGYHYLGGLGWKSLNEPISQPKGSTLTIKYDDFEGSKGYFKCVASFTHSSGRETLSQEFTIDKTAQYQIKITSSLGNSFNFGRGQTKLIAEIHNSSNNEKISIKYDENDNKKVISPPGFNIKWNYSIDHNQPRVISKLTNDRGNELTFKDLGELYNTTEIYCTVSFKIKENDKYVTKTATGSTILVNKKDNSKYTLVIENGEQVFKYDSQGFSPAYDAYDGQQREPLPLTFQLYDNASGRAILDINKTYRGQCSWKWILPVGKNNNITSMLDLSGLNDDDIIKYTPISLYPSGQTSTQYYSKAESLNYKIQNIFDPSRQDNNISLEVQYLGETVVASTNFVFVKDGSQGTNGTEYVARMLIKNKGGDYRLLYNNNNNSKKIIKYSNISVLNKDGLSIENGRSSLTKADFSFNVYNAADGSIESPKFSIDKNNLMKTGEYSEKNNSITINNAMVIRGISEETFGRTFYSYFPIAYVNGSENIGENYYILLQNGYNEVIYNSDGSLGRFVPTPFKIILIYFNPNNNTKQEIVLVEDENNKNKFITNKGTFTFKWTSSWGGEKEEYSTKNIVTIKPPQYFDGQKDYYITCNIKYTPSGESSKNITLIFRPYFHYNQYSMPAINNWDGTSIKIDQGNQYLLAPQMAAGKKGEQTNSFTGIAMGQTFTHNSNNSTNDSDTSQTGLFGYRDGVQTIFLDADTGSATFGKSGEGQIKLIPGGTSTIAGWNLNANSLDSPNNSIHLIANEINSNGIVTPGGSIYSNNHKNFENTTEGYYIGSDGISLGGAFSVDNKGKLISTSGTIGGWKITKDKLFSQKNSINLIAETGVIYSGSHDKLDSTESGYYIGSSGISLGNAFSVTSSGELTSTSGTIGGWKITSEYLAYTDEDKDKNGNITYRTIGLNPLAKTDGRAIVVGSPHKHSDSTWKGAPFEVYGNGDLYASSANITGVIQSNEGIIGGWKINSKGLNSIGESGGDSYKIELHSYESDNSNGETQYAFTVGKKNGTDYDEKFYVLYNGNMYAQKANITGIITADKLTAESEGSIAGWKIEPDKLSGGNITLKSEGTIEVGSITIKGDGTISGTDWSLTGGASGGSSGGFSGGGFSAGGGGVSIPSSAKYGDKKQTLDEYVSAIFDDLIVEKSLVYQDEKIGWRELKIPYDIDFSSKTVKFYKIKVLGEEAIYG